ncbi:IS5 family transposase [Acaryochloris marina]|uniref:Transposase, IS4 family n=1 Tax=Acaryochloris marina (strain MBIC 11017) TaxID=329726 RepID=B0CB38_ACAM1|nr:IS5 family transposase [Acaryochloris marina]ABW26677.1 transposase, IS4 family [Acaryochloris marina MBIC11017]BDM81466.1 IS5 family transposase [Acaryochloris marina MBIC10699]
MPTAYDSDLTTLQWELLEPLIPAAKPGGRPRTTDMRSVLNAILYLVVTGCQWRQLPHDFPCWSTVYSYFRRWRDDGTWVHINEHLRMQERVSEDRHPSPRAAICDAQSVKVGNPRCHSIGFDGGKQIKGRKRHVLVDTLGLVLMVIVTAANISDQRGAKILFWKARRQGASLSRLVRIWADAGYQGQAFMKWVMDRFQYVLEVIKRSDNLAGFQVIPKRWIVERTFGWLLWSRRLNKDYEVLTRTAEALVYVAMIRLMVRRLTEEA